MLGYKCKLCKLEGSREMLRGHLKAAHRIKKNLSDYMKPILPPDSPKQKVAKLFNRINIFKNW